MLTVEQVQDVEIQADEMLLRWMAEFNATYNQPTLETTAAIAIHNAPPEVLAQLPPDAVKKIKELKHGRSI